MAQTEDIKISNGNSIESVSHVLASLRAMNNRPFRMRLSDQVYEYVVGKIFESELTQGQKITESDLAKELQISTAPVREAMIRLAQEGWIKRIPNRGACVNNHIDPDNCRRLYSLRLCLEIGAFSHLAETVTDEQLAKLDRIVKDLERGIETHQISPYRHADTDFHLTIATFAGGERLREILKPVLLQIFVIVFSQDFIPLDVRPSASHRALYEAIAGHDAGKAAELISEHIYTQARAHNIEI